MLCTYYAQDMQDHSVSSGSSKYLASTLQHSLWYHLWHLLHSIISPSSSPRQWQYTFIVTSLHDLLFLVTLRPLNDLKTPLSKSRTRSLRIVFWSNIFLDGSSPLTMLKAFAIANKPQSLVPACTWILTYLWKEKSDISVSTSLKCKKSYYKT